MPPVETGNVQLLQADFRSPVDLLLSLFIRPPRCHYSPSKLGPRTFKINDKGHGRREDFVLHNPRGQTLQCSLFEPIPDPAVPTQENWSRERPCVIYLHGNSSCRLEALPLLPLLLPLRIMLFCFDFAGSGISEGEYISLGWFERDDLATCIEYLRSTGRVTRIALWGRSMGAFTAILHADRDPSIAGLVLDSPFVSLRDLATELARRRALIPTWAARAVLSAARSAIKARAGFDFEDIEGIDHVNKSFMPALFIAARGDDFIHQSHAERLFVAYQGEKELYLTDGDHHSSRTPACRQHATLFLCRAFHSPHLDALLHLHVGGAVDIFGTSVVPDGYRTGCRDLDVEGSEICRQMRMVPELSEMKLLAGRRCQRPVSMTATVNVNDAKVEAGFFIRLVAADVLDGGETDEVGLPCCLVLTFTQDLCMVSRVHSDMLRTLVVGPGLCGEANISLSLDTCGTLVFQREDQQLLCLNVGTAFRGELTLWQMLLRGKDELIFRSMNVEDSEATLSEHLGDAVLRLRHLGSHADGVLLLNRNSISRPCGDYGPSDGISVKVQSQPQTQTDPDLQRVTLECAWKPEVLIGWRVKIHGLGEGIITGIRKRRLRSTLFSVSGLSVQDSEGSQEISLARQASMIPWISGRRFDLLGKED